MATVVCPMCLTETREYFLKQNGMCNDCMAEKAATTAPGVTIERDTVRPSAMSAPRASNDNTLSRTRTKRPLEKDTEQLRAEEQMEAIDVTAPVGTGEEPHEAPSRRSLPDTHAAPHEDLPPIDWNSSWYEILGVARNAQIATIKAAYRRFSGLYHPDKAGAEHTATMQRINHIYAILSNSNTRKAYNNTPRCP